MRPNSFLKLFFVTLFFLIAAVLIWTKTPDYSIQTADSGLFFPDLMQKINTVEAVSVEHNKTALTFVRDINGNWSLIEADGYPVDKDRIRNTLIGLAGLEKIEPKTSLPDFYPDLGVEDQGKQGAASYQVTLLDSDGQKITTVLVGKRTSGLSWNGNGYYVRKPDEKQSWLVRGAVDVTGDAKTWMKTKILPLTRGRVSSYTVIDTAKNREGIYKRTVPQSLLQPIFFSDAYFLISDDFLENLEKNLTSFEFSSAVRRPEKLSKRTPFASVFIETFDGMNIYVFFYVIDKTPYAAVSFSAQESAPEKVKKESAKAEALHSAWLYKMDPDKISPLLPFLNVPEKEVSDKKSAETAKKKTTATDTKTKKQQTAKKKEAKK